MKERPIIFNAEMVRAILDDRKTQTRRILSPRQLKMINIAASIGECYPLECDHYHANSQSYYREWCPFGSVGDRLWVRETFADVNTENGPAFTYSADHGLKFCLDDESPVNYDRYPGKQFAMWCGDLWRKEVGHKWTPSIHMPRWASRITLEITGVRVERLQDISEGDALSEGLIPERCDHVRRSCQEVGCCGDTARGEFSALWQSIYGAESWNANSWVWVVEFKRV